jgi:hypothetical protein
VETDCLLVQQSVADREKEVGLKVGADAKTILQIMNEPYRFFVDKFDNVVEGHCDAASKVRMDQLKDLVKKVMQLTTPYNVMNSTRWLIISFQRRTSSC